MPPQASPTLFVNRLVHDFVVFVRALFRPVLLVVIVISKPLVDLCSAALRPLRDTFSSSLDVLHGVIRRQPLLISGWVLDGIGLMFPILGLCYSKDAALVGLIVGALWSGGSVDTASENRTSC